MKVTLNISDETMRAVKREAARRGQTVSQFVEAALREIVSPQPQAMALPPLPAFHLGKARVNVADRNALYEVMER
jgi:hypothetical protein